MRQSITTQEALGREYELSWVDDEGHLDSITMMLTDREARFLIHRAVMRARAEEWRP